MSFEIRVHLYKDRTRLGSLAVMNVENGLTVFKCDALGYADKKTAEKVGNQNLDPLHIDGNTPTGTYSGIPLAFAKNDYRILKFGPGWISLSPKSGDAKIAEKNGRAGIKLHAGPPSMLAWIVKYWHGLRPTNGCIRVSNPDLVSILSILGNLTVDVIVEEVL